MEKLIQYFTPEVYNLDLEISRESETIQGAVRIFGQPHSDFIKLHAVNIKIKNISVRKFDENAEHLNNKKLLKFLPCDFEQKDGEIKIKNFYHAENHTKNYILEFKIIFETKLNKNLQGCYLSKYIFNNKTEKIITTQFESHYARECFPCIDEPAAKAKFNLSLTIPDFDNDVVLANTEISRINEKDGKKQFVFKTTPRMSTYLLAWVVGKFHKVETVNQHGVKVASYAALNQSTSSLEFANEVAARALDYYDEKFGIKYPLEKLDQVALPDFEAGAMENWGLVTYRESCMLAEPDASIDTKQSVAATVTHELSHQWFGDLVTMAWWDDLWLNESFATIMEYYATAALYPEFNAWQDFFTGDCVAALKRDCLRGVQSVQQAVHDPAEIATLFDGAIVYAKGARLVLMLIRLMREEKFYQGVHDYFVEYQYNNTVGDDLWRNLQKYADFDVKACMHAWISQPGYPALQEAHNGDQTWWAQQRFLIDGTTDDTEWPLPKVTDDMSGHYLLDLSDAEFEQRLSQFDQLQLEQKLRLLIDRMMLAKAGLTPPESLATLLPKFAHEDAPTWDILLDVINDLKIFFPPETSIEDTYREFLRNMIYSRIREVGIKSQPDDTSNTKRLRSTLSVVARYARDTDIIDLLAAEYRSDLSNIDAEMRGNILMAKMLTDESTIYNILYDAYQTEVDPEIKDDILCTLASARQDDHIQRNIELLRQPDIVRPQDHLYLYIYLLRNSKARALALSWVYNNWDYIVQLTGEKSIEDYPRCMANFINTSAEAEQFYGFFAQHKDNPVLRRSIEMARSGIDARLSLIQSHSVAVQAKISQLTAKENI